ncbi:MULTISPECIES: M20 peptidase aminoacylase family protein [unclassified Cytobacillus]|uniref:M20 peptidase aminoacylase family protein n=1 Tax=unclassified Cytobacillus TaxID=2675268 RepID=UPI001358EECC|nr:M20 peptidase aminoacylase family protein [Cytobacillus sp. AMY 15.2]KAF0816134.1 Amidohydrolase AmhX [Bacillus sp. ZZV12-4809]MCM3093996.1 M20 peptidase aminoacylase family protein [Cytobacillus sp. AMY 15.2]
MVAYLKEKIDETFDYLHSHPELSWKETNTTEYIKKRLEQAGCSVKTFEDCTGVIGDYGDFSGDVPIVAIRADMDALWQEVNGELQANHSCGHDAHMTMVLGVLWKIQELEGLKDKVGVRFIFQPAEEVGAGALKLVDKGIVDNVDFLYGIHLRPVQETPDGYVTPAIMHGATGSMEFEIRGDDAHGARPHLTHNAIEIGNSILNSFNTIHLDPNVAHTIKATRFISGGKNTNIIPGSASLAIDLRAQTNEIMEKLRQRVLEILQSSSELFNTDIVLTNDYGIAAAEVSNEALEMAEQAIVNCLGEEKLVAPLITPGGDDFHFYTIKKPHLKATMVGLGCDLKPGLHHPNMTFNRDSLLNGINILSEIIILHSKKGC